MLNRGIKGLYRIGLLYAVYRVLISSTLIFIFGFTDYPLIFGSIFESPYMGIIAPYFLICLIQAIIYLCVGRKNLQVTICAVVDVILLSMLNWSLGQSNAYGALMFVVTLFVINLVLSRKNALVLTLASIIAVIYLPLLQGWEVSGYTDSNVISSLMLTLLFVAVSVMANVLVSRFQRLEAINEIQLDEITKFQEISSNVLEQIETGYVVLNDALEVILINNAAKQVMGLKKLTPESLLCISPELYKLIIDRREQHNDQFAFEYNQDGVSLQVTFRALRSSHELYLISLEDTDKINARVHYLKLASLGQLSASIAHEIRNPLASIDQAAKLLQDSVSADDKQMIDVIGRQCKRIDGIIQSTLNMARMDGFNPVQLDLWQAVNRALNEDLADIKDKVQIRKTNEAWAVFDADQFRQVLINLVRNAVRHNEKSASKHVEIRIYETPQKQICVDVVDYGSGVEESKIRNLFVPFFTTEINGTGLGLYLSKNLCEANSAKIDYVKLDDGACFRVLCQKAKIEKLGSV